MTMIDTTVAAIVVTTDVRTTATMNVGNTDGTKAATTRNAPIGMAAAKNSAAIDRALEVSRIAKIIGGTTDAKTDHLHTAKTDGSSATTVDHPHAARLGSFPAKIPAITPSVGWQRK